MTWVDEAERGQQTRGRSPTRPVDGGGARRGSGGGGSAEGLSRSARRRRNRLEASTAPGATLILADVAAPVAQGAHSGGRTQESPRDAPVASSTSATRRAETGVDAGGRRYREDQRQGSSVVIPSGSGYGKGDRRPTDSHRDRSRSGERDQRSKGGKQRSKGKGKGKDSKGKSKSTGKR